MDVWNNEIKPFMNNKFQSQFMDIFFLVNLIDGTLKGKKTIKRKDSKITKMKISFSEINKGYINLFLNIFKFLLKISSFYIYFIKNKIIFFKN